MPALVPALVPATALAPEQVLERERVQVTAPEQVPGKAQAPRDLPTAPRAR